MLSGLEFEKMGEISKCWLLAAGDCERDRTAFSSADIYSTRSANVTLKAKSKLIYLAFFPQQTYLPYPTGFNSRFIWKKIQRLEIQQLENDSW